MNNQQNLGTPWMLTELQKELGMIYAAQVWEDLSQNVELYNVYDGPGQEWQVNEGLDYKPTKRVTNHIKHLIKEVARFMFSRAPEITIQAVGDDKANADLCAELEAWIRGVLEDNGWAGKLPKAGRDCFIGKRVALKLSGKRGSPIRIRFRSSVEFFFDIQDDDTDIISKVIFYYHQNNDPDPAKQRIWWQKYSMDAGKCVVDEAIFDGYGVKVKGEDAPALTGLDGLPAHVIINDGLTGDVLGESDVEELQQGQNAYNRMTSDDQDALKFNMFPMKVFKDASGDCMKSVKVSPGAMVDLQTDAGAANGNQADASILESQFGYDARFEHAVERVKKDMYQLLSVPEFSIENLKSLGVSGKAMKALYWPLICRCEEKWAAWDTAIRWLVRMLVKMGAAFGGKDFTKAQYTIGIEHLYPIPDDEEDERKLDLQEVNAKARSRKSYVEKWQPTADADTEIEQMAVEARMADQGY